MATAEPEIDDPRISRIGLKIAKEAYEPDQATVQQYQAYSTELLRLSLLGIAAVGFLLKDLVFSEEGTKNSFDQRLLAHSWTIVVALLALASSAAFALGHRYYSSDSFACMIRFIRLADPQSPVTLNRRKMRDEKNRVAEAMRLATWAVFLSAIALAIGAAFLALAFILVLM